MRARAISPLHPALLRQGEVKQEANIERYICIQIEVTQMFEEKSGIVITYVNWHF